MIYRPHFLYRLKLFVIFLLVKLEFLHFLLPKAFVDELPMGWNNHMFWIAFKTGGEKVYFEYYCKMREPESYEPKAISDPKYQLTEEDIRAFYKNGSIGPFDLVPSEDIDKVREHLINLISTDSQVYSYQRGDYKFENKQNPNGKERNIESLTEVEKYFATRLNEWDRHLEDPTLMNIFQSPDLVERCAQLLGPNLVVWATHFFNTPPQSEGSPWHQNATWLNADMKESMIEPPDDQELFELTCWIALTDAPKERSCLTIVPGTNREIYPIRTSKEKSAEGKASRIYGDYGTEIDYEVAPNQIKYLEAKAGQCVIFCERAIHGSTNNVTDLPRWTVVGRIIKPDTKIHSTRMREQGFQLKVHGIQNIKLDNWKPVLLRGEDRFQLNK